MKGLSRTIVGMVLGIWVVLAGVHADTLAGNTPQAPVEATAYSNGCGGDTGVGSISDALNWFLDTQTYVDSNINPLAPSITVNFRAACDLHDAGYSGGVVYDRINGGTVDFRSWDRRRIDGKFLEDLRTICRQQVPNARTVALEKCLNKGGPASVGAQSYYEFVREYGTTFFDADPVMRGTQKTGSRANN